MKVFLFRILSFLIFIILFLSINNIANYYIFNNLKIPIDYAKIIIAGDSHPQRSLNPNLLPSAVNISQSAEPYIITYWKLRYIFQHYKPKILILGFSHHNISAFNDRKFWDKKWSSEMFKRSYIIGDFESLKEIKIDKKEYINIYLRQMCLYPHCQHINFIGNYNNCNNNDLSDVKNAIKRHYYFNGKELGISNNAIIYLDAIISLCKENNVIIILIGSPVYKDYYKSIPNKIKKRYNKEKSRLKQCGIIVFDFSHEKYNNTLYLNADHLNEQGASLFTKKIALLLKDMIEIKKNYKGR